MVQLTDVAVEFGTQELYRDVNLFIGPQDRIGLVGPNGSGKTTILRLIAGQVEPSAGSVELRRGTRVAYLPQSTGWGSDRTVLEEVLRVFDSQEHDSEAKARKVLTKLGFADEDLTKMVREESGGFRMRLTLAKLLLSEPDLLLLDEPTNYLDIRSIEWLQDYLAHFKGALVMVAHDRYFLDGLVERIWAIEGKRVLAFSGNYSQYLQDKEHRDELQLKRFEEQQRFIRRTERFIAQFRARKDTAKRAQSRQKMLDRLERIEPPRVLPQIRIRFPEAERIYGKAFELKGVSKAFGGKRLFQGVNLTIAGSERVGVFGPNGAGKTTLLEIIAGSLEPDSGTVWRSAKIRIAYYRQGAEGLLDERRTVLEAVAEATTGYTENELKGILGMFLFPGDAIEKRVGVLSGGERSRLAIIRALLEPSNLLILDEPTNHLDIESREVLIRAIESYHRCVVFAAHDRFMLDRLATRTILVENGEVVQFPGNYSYATGRVGQVETKPELAGPAVEGSESEPHSPTSIIKRTNVVERLEERLKQVRAEYQAALAVMDFSRARMLAMEEKELETEINARKADEVADSTTEV